jgi:transposase
MYELALPIGASVIDIFIADSVVDMRRSKRGGKVYTKIISDASSATLFLIMSHKIMPASIVYSDDWRGNNVLVVSEPHHFRVKPSELFANKKNHINGIEKFWNQAKRHMRKFNGVPRAHFGLF